MVVKEPSNNISANPVAIMVIPANLVKKEIAATIANNINEAFVFFVL